MYICVLKNGGNGQINRKDGIKMGLEYADNRDLNNNRINR